MSDSKENLPAPISQEKSAQTHIDRLLKELDGLKDSNKELTEKLQVKIYMNKSMNSWHLTFKISRMKIRKLKLKPTNNM